MPQYRGGLTAASYPAPLEVWRVTVRRAGEAARVGLEILTLGWWDTSVQSIADDWAQRVNVAGLGTVFALPVVSEEGETFVVDMRFDSTATWAPASAIVAAWEDQISNCRVEVVERVGAGAQTGQAAEDAKAKALTTAEKEREEESWLKQLGDKLGQLGTGLVVVTVAGAVIALAFLVRRRD
jgi:hypothetical protein